MNTACLASLLALASHCTQDPEPPARPAPTELDAAAVTAAVEKAMADRDCPGAVVGIVRGSALVYVRAFGLRDLDQKLAMTTDTLFQIGSVTKPITATLVARLAQRKVLGWDDAVGKHLPQDLELPAPIAAITLRQLATHRSGLPANPVNRRNLPNSPSVMLPYGHRELYEGLRSTELQSEPGKSWSYSNLGYGLLGHVLERASGKSYAEILHQELLLPLGMASTSVDVDPEREKLLANHHWPEDSPRTTRPRWKFGEVVGFGGVTSNIHDLARFVAMQYGAIEGAPLDLDAAGALHAPVADGEPRPGMRVGMGTGWFTYALPGLGEVVGHGGEVDGHGSCLAILLASRAGIVVLANVGGDTAETLCQAVLRAAAPSLLAR